MLKRDRDLLARRGPGAAALPASSNPLWSSGCSAAGTRGREHRLDPLLPFTALMRQRMAQPHPCTQTEDVIEAGSTTPATARSSTTRADAWRPRDRSSRAACCCACQLSAPVQPGARPLRPVAAPRPRTASRSWPLAPPRAPDHRIAARPANTGPVRRRDPRVRHLPGVGVEPLRGASSSSTVHKPRGPAPRPS